MRERIGTPLFIAAFCLLFMGAANASHFPPWTSFHSEAPAFLASAFILCGTAFHQPRLGAGIVVVAVLAALAWAQFASGLIPHAGDAWVVTAYLAAFAAAWLGGAAAACPKERSNLLYALSVALLGMGLLAAFQCLAQWAQVDDHWAEWVFLAAQSSRAVGNFGQPNQTATLLLMAVAAAGSLVIQERLGRAVGWALSLVFGWAVVLTQSRTALLSAVMLVAGVVCLSLLVPTLRPWRKHALTWLAFLFAATWAYQIAPVQGTKGPIGAEAMVTIGLRPVLWTQLSFAALQQPWFGFGWLQVSTAQQAGAMRFPGIEQTNYAHNVILDLVVMIGIPIAVLLLVAAAVWIVRRVIRLWHKRPAEAAVAGALFMLVPFAVHAQLELPHAYSYFLVLVGLLLGVFDGATRTPGEDVHVPCPMIAAAAAILIVLFGVLAYEYSAVEEDFRITRFENRRLGETPGDYVPPEPRFLTQLGDMLAATRLRAARNMPAEELDTLARASRRYTWAPLQFRAALALALNGRPKEAAENLQVIRDLFPKDIVKEGRDNWERLQRESYPELSAVPFPPIR